MWFEMLTHILWSEGVSAVRIVLVIGLTVESVFSGTSA